MSIFVWLLVGSIAGAPARLPPGEDPMEWPGTPGLAGNLIFSGEPDVSATEKGRAV